MAFNPSLEVTGIVLAGGASSRLGENKALIDVQSVPLIERVVHRLQTVVHEVILVTHTPELFAYLGMSMVDDVYAGLGTLGGLHAGLHALQDPYGLVVGCDMPFLNPDLLSFMIGLRSGCDVVMPRLGTYHEPLHALYARRCLPTIEQGIAAGQRRVLLALDGLQICYVNQAEIEQYDPQHLSFFNVNTPEDLAYLTRLSAGQVPGIL